jgi:hypothetical protein
MRGARPYSLLVNNNLPQEFLNGIENFLRLWYDKAKHHGGIDYEQS